MKKTIIILLVIVFLLMLGGAQTTRAIHAETPIFEAPDFNSTIIFSIPKNAQVIVLEEATIINNIPWVKVQYGSYEGYVNSNDLYTTNDGVSYTMSYIKATSSKMGETIHIYKSNSTESQVITSVKDGTKLLRVVSDIYYGDFYEISYNEERAFIQKKNATSSLTYNQKTALVIGAATLIVIALMFLLIRFIRKNRRKAKN